jgi:Predicted oxidoreductases (related to aryl-alcohol dehydrogenases)
MGINPKRTIIAKEIIKQYLINYKIMEYRKLGNSSLSVSVITFGAWAAGGWMWGGTERKSAIDAIKASYDRGVTSIDTAPIYGQGTSEEIVGEAIKGIARDKVQILTKFGMRWDLAKGDLAMHSQKTMEKKLTSTNMRERKVLSTNANRV